MPRNHHTRLTANALPYISTVIKADPIESITSPLQEKIDKLVTKLNDNKHKIDNYDEINMEKNLYKMKYEKLIHEKIKIMTTYQLNYDRLRAEYDTYKSKYEKIENIDDMSDKIERQKEHIHILLEKQLENKKLVKEYVTKIESLKQMNTDLLEKNKSYKNTGGVKLKDLKNKKYHFEFNLREKTDINDYNKDTYIKVLRRYKHLIKESDLIHLLRIINAMKKSACCSVCYECIDKL